jgi:hypothetical protein
MVAGLLALLLVAADAEGALARTGERNHADLGRGPRSLKQAISSSTVCAVNAFNRSGRSIVIQARPLCCSWRTSVSSCMVVPPCSRDGCVLLPGSVV